MAESTWTEEALSWLGDELVWDPNPSRLHLDGSSGCYVDTPRLKALAVTAGTMFRAANLVTWTAPPPNHGIRVGDIIVVNTSDTSYGGTRTVLTVDPTGITWAQTAADDPDAGTGLVSLTDSFRMAGPIEAWAEVAAASYLPASVVTLGSLYAADPNKSIMWQIDTAGKPRILWSPTGNVAQQVTATAANPISAPDANRITVRFLFYPVYGTGWRVEFQVYTAVDGTLLEDLGPATGTPSSTVATGVAPFEIGSWAGGTTERFTGEVYRFVLRDGIGTTAPVLLTYPDFTIQTPGATEFDDNVGRRFVLHGTAAIIDDPQPVPEPEPEPEPPPIEETRDLVALILNDIELELVLENGYVNTALDLGWPEIRTVSAPRPGVDGTIDTTELFGARAVTVNVACVNSDDATWKQNLRRLGRYVSAKSRPRLHVRLDEIDYWMDLAPDNVTAPFETPNHAMAQLGFRAPYPYLFSEAQTVSSGAFRPGSAGRTYPWSPPRVYPASDAVSGEFEVENLGDAAVWPVIRVAGPLTATSWTLTNATTGETFSMSATTVEVGHSLVVDMLNRTARYDGQPTLSRFSLIDFATSRWVHLEPGVNELRFAVGTTPSDAILSVEWADPFLWPGGSPP